MYWLGTDVVCLKLAEFPVDEFDDSIVLIILIPYWRFKIPEKKYFIPLLGFSLSMGTGVFLFMNLALQEATIVSPIKL